VDIDDDDGEGLCEGCFSSLLSFINMKMDGDVGALFICFHFVTLRYVSLVLLIFFFFAFSSYFDSGDTVECALGNWHTFLVRFFWVLLLLRALSFW